MTAPDDLSIERMHEGSDAARAPRHRWQARRPAHAPNRRDDAGRAASGRHVTSRLATGRWHRRPAPGREDARDTGDTGRVRVTLLPLVRRLGAISRQRRELGDPCAVGRHPSARRARMRPADATADRLWQPQAPHPCCTSRVCYPAVHREPTRPADRPVATDHKPVTKRPTPPPHRPDIVLRLRSRLLLN